MHPIVVQDMLHACPYMLVLVSTHTCMHNSGQHDTHSVLFMPPLPASIGPFAPLHRGMIKCSGSYVFTPDGAMRAWQTWVSATGRLIRSARGPANLRIGGLCWFRQCHVLGWTLCV